RLHQGDDRLHRQLLIEATAERVAVRGPASAGPRRVHGPNGCEDWRRGKVACRVCQGRVSYMGAEPNPTQHTTRRLPALPPHGMTQAAGARSRTREPDLEDRLTSQACRWNAVLAKLDLRTRQTPSEGVPGSCPAALTLCAG